MKNEVFDILNSAWVKLALNRKSYKNNFRTGNSGTDAPVPTKVRRIKLL